jgi:Flp pilus assembly protein TadB
VFLAPLYSTRTGVLMLTAAAVLMGSGVLWTKKLTKIEA